MPYGNRAHYFKDCPVCKKKFKLPFWQLKTKKTCSFDCSKEFKRRIPIKKETLLKISKKLKGRYLKEESSQWKGDSASYESKHEWVRKEYKRVNKELPRQCQKCYKEKKRLEFANLSGKHRRELSDYFLLCKQCHNLLDGRNSEYFRRLQKLKISK